MEVIVSISSLAPESGGPSRSTSSLCGALGRLGVNIDLLTLDFGGVLSAPILPVSERVRACLSPGIYWPRWRVVLAPRFRATLRRLAQGRPPAVIHDNGLWLPTNRAAAAVARQLGIPLVVSPRGMISPWALHYKAWKKWLPWHLYQRRNLASAAVLHATSAVEAGNLRDLGFHQPIAVIPNGVDLPPESESGPVRCPDGRRTALFVGRINPGKGLLNLIAAWAEAKPAGWRLVIAGPDENGHRAEVERAVRAAGLESGVVFTGAVEGQAKWDLYRSADLFVLPTFTENFGLVIAEALAAGVPVITTRGAPWAELESHGCGWWIEIGAAPLAAALRTATGLDENERRTMGQRGRTLVAERYSWSGVATQMRDVYDWILHRGRKPDCVQLSPEHRP